MCDRVWTLFIQPLINELEAKTNNSHICFALTCRSLSILGRQIQKYSFVCVSQDQFVCYPNYLHLDHFHACLLPNDWNDLIEVALPSLQAMLAFDFDLEAAMPSNSHPPNSQCCMSKSSFLKRLNRSQSLVSDKACSFGVPVSDLCASAVDISRIW